MDMEIFWCAVPFSVFLRMLHFQFIQVLSSQALLFYKNILKLTTVICLHFNRTGFAMVFGVILDYFLLAKQHQSDAMGGSAGRAAVLFSGVFLGISAILTLAKAESRRDQGNSGNDFSKQNEIAVNVIGLSSNNVDGPQESSVSVVNSIDIMEREVAKSDQSATNDDGDGDVTHEHTLNSSLPNHTLQQQLQHHQQQQKQQCQHNISSFSEEAVDMPIFQPEIILKDLRACFAGGSFWVYVSVFAGVLGAFWSPLSNLGYQFFHVCLIKETIS